MASWLDNDGDGCVDTPAALAAILQPRQELQACIAFPGTREQTDKEQLEQELQSAGLYAAALVYNDDDDDPDADYGLLPSCCGPSATPSCVDTSLEEIWHAITDVGYGQAFPETFARDFNSNSKLTLAMDEARGGKFEETPSLSEQPSTAWFTFNEPRCDYQCQATEYIYWGVVTWVGAIANRGEQIREEWDFLTRDELVAGDVKMTEIIRDTDSYRLPSVSPTGKYYGGNTCANVRADTSMDKIGLKKFPIK